MKQIKSVGNYLQCPYCETLFGNGISIVYSNIVKSCSCEGMKEAVKNEKLQEEVDELRKHEQTRQVHWHLKYKTYVLL